MDYMELKSFKARWQQFFTSIRNHSLLQNYLIDFHLDYNPEPVKFRKDTLRALIISLIFATIFGIYERLWAFTIFNEFFYDNIYLHWGLWWAASILIAYFTTNRRWSQIFVNLLIVLNFEDFIYWMVEWIVERQFPFPAKNWWDREITPFRVLGNWGEATRFWPYFPRFYYIVGTVLILYYLTSILGGPKASQIMDWILLPVLLPFIAGFITSEFGFIVILIVMSSLGYGWGIYLLSLKYKQKKLSDTS